MNSDLSGTGAAGTSVVSTGVARSAGTDEDSARVELTGTDFSGTDFLDTEFTCTEFKAFGGERGEDESSGLMGFSSERTSSGGRETEKDVEDADFAEPPGSDEGRDRGKVWFCAAVRRGSTGGRLCSRGIGCGRSGAAVGWARPKDLDGELDCASKGAAVSSSTDLSSAFWGTIAGAISAVTGSSTEGPRVMPMAIANTKHPTTVSPKIKMANISPGDRGRSVASK